MVRAGILKAVIAVLSVLGAFLASCAMARAGERWLYIGADGGKHAITTYNGVLWAPFNKLGETGPQARMEFQGLVFDYDTHLPDRQRRPVKVNVQAHGFGGSGELGYQYVAPNWRLAGFAGAAWRHFKLTPDDPGSDLDGSKWLFSAKLDGEVKLFENHGVMANGSFLTGVKQYWVEVKPFMDLGRGVKIGPSVAYFGGKGYEMMRAGAYLQGYEVPVKLPGGGRVFVGGTAGVQLDLHDKRATAFGGLNFGVLF